MSEEIKAQLQIAKRLTTEDIKKLLALLNVPSGYCENVTEGNEFIYLIKKWGKHNRFLFYKGLHSIGRADLAESAIKVKWLAIDSPIEGMEGIETDKISEKTLVRILKTEFVRKEWFAICLIIPNLEVEMSFEAKMKIFSQEGYISKDLSLLIGVMEEIERNDIVEKLRLHQTVFTDIPDEVFKKKFNKEVASLLKEIFEWEIFLKKFTKTQQRKVKQLEDDDPVDIESVYVDLTIIEEKPRASKSRR